jgi:hypothetical protein
MIGGKLVGEGEQGTSRTGVRGRFVRGCSKEMQAVGLSCLPARSRIATPQACQRRDWMTCEVSLQSLERYNSLRLVRFYI